jgi:hypothetical protein
LIRIQDSAVDAAERLQQWQIETVAPDPIVRAEWLFPQTPASLEAVQAIAAVTEKSRSLATENSGNRANPAGNRDRQERRAHHYKPKNLQGLLKRKTS